MQHTSRRSARASRAGEADRRRRKRRRRIWLSVGILAVVVLGTLVWLGSRVLVVKGELEALQSVVLASDDGMTIDARLSSATAHAANAASAANDPVWAVAEFVPVVGANLKSVRVTSDGIDYLLSNVAMPVVAAKQDPSAGSMIAVLLPILQQETPRIRELASEMEKMRRDTALVGPVKAGVDQISDALNAATPFLDVIPPLLGADGERSYLLVFQNSAEVLPLGGSAASQTLVTVNEGNLAIGRQASSAIFDQSANGPVDVAVDQSALDLYTDFLVSRINTSTSRPDFPTAAKILTAWWQREIDPAPLDGVISIDPIALGRILLATGPITIGEVELTSENALTVLLSDVYRWWDPYASPEEAMASDAFFAGVAQTVFAKLSTGEFDIRSMMWAVDESISRGDIMVWSEDRQIAELIAGQRVEGVLPTDNSEATTVGVYFRDTSASKIDYYMNSWVDLSESCDGQTARFDATARLQLGISQEDADALPAYVQSFHWGSEKFRTEVFVYGPPGTSFVEASVDGRDLRPTRTDITDLGRPVAAFEVFLMPGESGTVTASFAGEGEFGPLELRSTPMIRDTVTTVTSACG